MPSASDTTRVITAALKERLAGISDGLFRVVGDATDVLEIEVRRQAALEDHSLKDLRRMGHPYRIRAVLRTVAGKVLKDAGFAGATKNGGWRAGIGTAAREFREGQLGHDIKLVHVQSHRLQDAITREVFRVGDYAIVGKVSVDLGKAPHAKWIITGTRKMIPRDFFGRAAVIARSRVLQVIRTGLNGIFRNLKAAA
jgi:hypothetical protein